MIDDRSGPPDVAVLLRATVTGPASAERAGVRPTVDRAGLDEDAHEEAGDGG